MTDSLAGRGWFLNERLFAYRLSPDSLTSQILDNYELLTALSTVTLQSTRARDALHRRARKIWYVAFKQCVKRGNAMGFLSTFPTPWHCMK